jgi:hypothetical protein
MFWKLITFLTRSLLAFQAQHLVSINLKLVTWVLRWLNKSSGNKRSLILRLFGCIYKALVKVVVGSSLFS